MRLISQLVVLISSTAISSAGIPRDLGYYLRQPSQSVIVSGVGFAAAVSGWNQFSRICKCNSAALQKYKIVIHPEGGNFVVDFFKSFPRAHAVTPEAQFLISPTGRVLRHRLME